MTLRELVGRVRWELRERGRRLGPGLRRLRERAGPAARGLRERSARVGARLRPWWDRLTWKQLGAALAVSLVVLWLVWERCGLMGCPNVDSLAAYQPGGAPVVLDRRGEEITELAPFSRELVRLDELPDHVPAAFVAVEDQRFYEHGGVDVRRVGGSVLANLRAGGISEGFSTITMQLARNVFPERLPGSERTPRRKLLEVRVAREIEDHFTKEEILQLYLNHIYFGGALYGIEAAARSYFGKSASRLSLHEAATLAAMPKAPNSYSPRQDPERARERRDLVLALMAAQGRITADEAAAASDRSIRVRSDRGRVDREEVPPAPYFVRAVRRILEDRLGDGLYTAPYRIHTTLDPAAQRAAEEAISAQLRSIERGAYGRYRGERRYGAADAVDDAGTLYLQGAAVVLDADSGDVLALVGGRDYGDSPFDRAIGARRQVGSAFKPFVYAAALEDGYVPSQRLTDEPLRMELEGGEVWEPANFDGGYDGEVTLREAAVRSNNVATVRLALAVGMDDVAQTARESGVSSPMRELPSLALGTAGLSLLELTAAYTPFAAGGQAVRPRFVTRVEDPDGGVIWEPEVERREAVDPGVAYLVTDLLRDALDRGTGRAVRDAGFRGPAAGKTGTTDDGHDVWFVGYTPDVVGGVWIGLDRPAPITGRATGGRLAAPVWARMMSRVQRSRGEPGDWERPESVVERRVDPASGLVLAEGCRPERGEARTEVFLEDELPAEICPAGEEEEGLLSRIGSRIRSVLRGIGDFIGGLFGDEEDEEERRRRDEYLGRPRLPSAAEVRDRVLEPRDTILLEVYEEPLGVPVEELPPGYGEVPVQPETIQLEVEEVPPPEPEPGDTIILLRPEPVTPPPDTAGAETDTSAAEPGDT